MIANEREHSVSESLVEGERSIKCITKVEWLLRVVLSTRGRGMQCGRKHEETSMLKCTCNENVLKYR